MGLIRWYEHTFTSVGAVLVEEAVQVPWSGKILRARADVTAGTAINTVAFAFRKVSGAAGSFDTILEYALTADPLDSLESGAPIPYRILVPNNERCLVDAFWAVSVDDATLDHTISVQVEIEMPAHPNAYGQGAF